VGARGKARHVRPMNPYSERAPKHLLAECLLISEQGTFVLINENGI